MKHAKTLLFALGGASVLGVVALAASSTGRRAVTSAAEAVVGGFSPSGRRKLNWKQLPFPASLRTHILPPISSTSWEEIDSPSPVPP